MKTKRLENGNLEILIVAWEKKVLTGLFRLYPQPRRACNLTKNGGINDAEYAQTLLEENLKETQLHHQEVISRLLKDTEEQGAKRFRIILRPTESETLLQVLNDIRIGSWLALGAPEKKLTELDENTAPHVWAMELATIFQAELLEALQRP